MKIEYIMKIEKIQSFSRQINLEKGKRIGIIDNRYVHSILHHHLVHFFQYLGRCHPPHLNPQPRTHVIFVCFVFILIISTFIFLFISIFFYLKYHNGSYIYCLVIFSTSRSSMQLSNSSSLPCSSKQSSSNIRSNTPFLDNVLAVVQQKLIKEDQSRV